MRFILTLLFTATLLAGRPAIVADPSFLPPFGLAAGASVPPLPPVAEVSWPGSEPWPDAGPTLAAAPETRSPAASHAVLALAGALDGLLDQPRWRNATFGVLVVDAEQGDTLFARNADRAMAPASNLKVLTTAAALHYLGPDFRWRTWVTTEAPIVDGVVRGDVVLYGTGDPALVPTARGRSGALDELAAALAAQGIHRIEGRVVADASHFRGAHRREEWDPRDLNDWFAAASSALGFNENVVQLRVQATTPGAAPQVHFNPPVAGVEIDNRATTVPGRGTGVHIVRDDPDEPIRIVGRIGAEARDVYRTITVRDPDSFAALAFVGALRDAGIAVTGTAGTVVEAGESSLSAARVYTDARPRLLARHRSAPLTTALARVNQESHNLYADLVLKTLGRAVLGDGSFAGGAEVVHRYLRDEVGVAADSLAVLDGSGLAAANRTTPRHLVAALQHALASPLGTLYLETLPEAGTPRLRRMARTPAAGNLRAKTGTIERVSALSGVVHSADGRPLLFAVIGNDLPSSAAGKRLEDDIGEALATWSGAP